MGARNVALVFETGPEAWPGLPPRAFRLLVYMALRSLDTETDSRPPRLYFGGREDMARALGYRLGKSPQDDTNAYEQVRRAVADMVKHGAVTRIGGGHAGRRTEYRLNLDLVAKTPREGAPTVSGRPDAPAAKTPREGAPQTPREGAPQTPRSGGERPPATVPPRNHRGATEEITRGERSSARLSSHQGDAHDALLDEDPARTAATRALERAGPDEADRLLQAALDELGPDATTRDRILHAGHAAQEGTAA